MKTSVDPALRYSERLPQASQVRFWAFLRQIDSEMRNGKGAHEPRGLMNLEPRGEESPPQLGKN